MHISLAPPVMPPRVIFGENGVFREFICFFCFACVEETGCVYMYFYLRSFGKSLYAKRFLEKKKKTKKRNKFFSEKKNKYFLRNNCFFGVENR